MGVRGLGSWGSGKGLQFSHSFGLGFAAEFEALGFDPFP